MSLEDDHTPPEKKKELLPKKKKRLSNIDTIRNFLLKKSMVVFPSRRTRGKMRTIEWKNGHVANWGGVGRVNARLAPQTLKWRMKQWYVVFNIFLDIILSNNS